MIAPGQPFSASCHRSDDMLEQYLLECFRHEGAWDAQWPCLQCFAHPLQLLLVACPDQWGANRNNGPE